MTFTVVRHGGATMRAVVCTDWTAAVPYVPSTAKIKESGVEARQRCRIQNWHAIQPNLVYQCHDVFPAQVDSQGRLRVLTVVRADQNAPLLAWNWMVGGRVLPTIEPEERQLEISAVNKLTEELGIEPSLIEGLYPMGFGQTCFGSQMIYESRDGREQFNHCLGRRISTINANYVALLKPEFDPADALHKFNTLREPRWVTQSDLEEPEFRAAYCDYMIELLHHLFRSWKKRTVH